MAANWLRPQGPVRAPSSSKLSAPGAVPSSPPPCTPATGKGKAVVSGKGKAVVSADEDSPPPRTPAAGKGKAVVSGKGKAVVSADEDGWMKPAKVARRVSPARSGAAGGQAVVASSFGALSHFEAPAQEVVSAEELCSALGLPLSGCKRGRDSLARSSLVRAGGTSRSRAGPSVSAVSSPVPAGSRAGSGRRKARHRRMGSGKVAVQVDLASVVLPGGSFGGGVGDALLASEVPVDSLTDAVGAATAGLEEGELDASAEVAAGWPCAGEAGALVDREEVVGLAGGGDASLIACRADLHQDAVERVRAALAVSSPASCPAVRPPRMEGARPMEVSPVPPPCGVQGTPSSGI